MKIGLTINDHFANILNAVGQKNKVKLGGVCRLIVESQLTFYLQTGKIPTFFNSVGFTYGEKQEEKSQTTNDHKIESIRKESESGECLDWDEIQKQQGSEIQNETLEDPNDGLPF